MNKRRVQRALLNITCRHPKFSVDMDLTFSLHTPFMLHAYSPSHNPLVQNYWSRLQVNQNCVRTSSMEYIMNGLC